MERSGPAQEHLRVLIATHHHSVRAALTTRADQFYPLELKLETVDATSAADYIASRNCVDAVIADLWLGDRSSLSFIYQCINAQPAATLILLRAPDGPVDPPLCQDSGMHCIPLGPDAVDRVVALLAKHAEKRAHFAAKPRNRRDPNGKLGQIVNELTWTSGPLDATQ